MPENSKSSLELISQAVQVVSVVAGVVISVWSFNATQQKEASAREAESRKEEIELNKYYDQRKNEARRQAIEAAKPFIELRQKRYAEALRAAAVLSSPENHTQDEIKKAKVRFWDLYWAELSLVEGKDVEKAMIGMGEALSPNHSPEERHSATYKLSHALRDSLKLSWQITDPEKENP